MNNLVALQEIYEHQEIELANTMAALEAEAEDYQTQIAAAERRADELEEYIAEQNRLIEEQKRREEEENQKEEDDEKKPDGDLTDPTKDPEFTSDVTGEELVAYALQFVGNPYKYGGTSLTNGADCSGFVLAVFAEFGVELPHYSVSQSQKGTAIDVSEVLPGDLIFYSNGSRINHVAIYIGNGQAVHASSPKTGIKISNYNYRTPVKARRILVD
jgi:cell wall-associated NlpC family hydrolase